MTLNGARLVTRPRDDAALIADRPGLEAFIATIDPGAPIAVDAERAQSFRYSAKAYLLQFRQADHPTCLLDPVALAPANGLADLSDLSNALVDCEWVLHAASQDLPCLAEVGLIPRRIFDTELAGRLLNLPRVSLSAMLTHYLGIQLAKSHSAEDWSKRPLPPAWLAYAALDVDYLLELRTAVGHDLSAVDKAVWAEQEFTDVTARFTVSPASESERWRGLKSLGKLRTARDLVVARSLWDVRDQLAQRTDISPGRIVPDGALVAAAATLSHAHTPELGDLLAKLPGFTGPFARRNRSRWTSAVANALATPPATWPHRHQRPDVPAPRLWQQSRPLAAARWEVARPAVVMLAEQVDVPPENLLTVATLARVLWPEDADLTEAGLRIALAEAGARPWQCDLVAPVLAVALRDGDH